MSSRESKNPGNVWLDSVPWVKNKIKASKIKTTNVYHFWIGTHEGVIMSTSNKCPLLKHASKMKYMGTSSDIGYPKKLSTGRMLHESNDKSRLRQRKKKKELSQC